MSNPMDTGADTGHAQDTSNNQLGNVPVLPGEVVVTPSVEVVPESAEAVVVDPPEKEANFANPCRPVKNNRVYKLAGWLPASPGNQQRAVSEYLEQLLSQNMIGKDGLPSDDWANAHIGGASVTHHEALEERVNDTSRDWQQEIKSGDRTIKARSFQPDFPDGKVLRTAEEVQRVTHNSTDVMWPLPNSGFQVSLKPPTSKELMFLNIAILDEKIKFGLDSYGSAWSLFSQRLKERCIEFTLDHVTGTSLRIPHGLSLRDMVKEHLSQMDADIILAGLLHAYSPEGLDFTRARINTDTSGKAEYQTVTERLRFVKATITDRGRLDTRCLQILGVTPNDTNDNKVSLDDLAYYKAYINKQVPAEKRTFKFPWEMGEDDYTVFIHFKTPTFNESTMEYRQWLSQLQQMLESPLLTAPDDLRRNQYLQDAANLAGLRQWCHFVERIVYVRNSDGREITIEGDGCREQLGNWSEINWLIGEIYNATLDYIGEAYVGCVAVPLHGELEPNRLVRWPWLTPIDVCTAFFTLLGFVTARTRAA